MIGYTDVTRPVQITLHQNNVKDQSVSLTWRCGETMNSEVLQEYNQCLADSLNKLFREKGYITAKDVGVMPNDVMFNMTLTYPEIGAVAKGLMTAYQTIKSRMEADLLLNKMTIKEM